MSAVDGTNAGSSPLTRGALGYHGTLAGRHGLIPADAGSTTPQSALSFMASAHPR